MESGSMTTESGSSEPVDYIERTRSQYDALGYPPYTWVHNPESPPFTPLSKPLDRARVGLICSGGIYARGQIAFHFKDDVSYRKIAMRTPRHELRVTHFAYDLKDARRDPAVVFPARTLTGLADAGAKTLLVDMSLSVEDLAVTIGGKLNLPYPEEFSLQKQGAAHGTFVKSILNNLIFILIF